jgi:hypothetical protein
MVIFFEDQNFITHSAQQDRWPPDPLQNRGTLSSWETWHPYVQTPNLFYM